MTQLIRTVETPSGRVPIAPPVRRRRAGSAAAPGRLRKARMSDVAQIEEIVRLFADRDEMLHRSQSEIQANIRDYFVVEEEEELVGCAALHVDLAHLAEVKALAVAEDRQGRGYGKQLVLACIEEGRQLGLQSVFALTYRPGFFEKLGFRVVEKATLPHKVWTECIRCPKFPDCGEIAVVRDLEVA
jgi:amino-acid N-acetyltransferase